jgi:hypothetical protein
MALKTWGQGLRIKEPKLGRIHIDHQTSRMHATPAGNGQDVTYARRGRDGYHMRSGFQPEFEPGMDGTALIELWKQAMHSKQHEKWKILISMMSSEEEYFWKDQAGAEANPPWRNRMQVNWN